MNDLFLRVKHKLIAYHFRYDRNHNNVLAICTCGWKCRAFRTGLKGYARKAKCIFGHKWDDWKPMEFGEVYEASSGDWVSTIDDPNINTTVGYMRQCDQCYVIQKKE